MLVCLEVVVCQVPVAAKWNWCLSVAVGVSVGYFDTEDAAARAYDRAAIGLLGRQNCRTILNFPIEEYDHDSVPELVGKRHWQLVGLKCVGKTNINTSWRPGNINQH